MGIIQSYTYKLTCDNNCNYYYHINSTEKYFDISTFPNSLYDKAKFHVIKILTDTPDTISPYKIMCDRCYKKIYKSALFTDILKFTNALIVDTPCQIIVNNEIINGYIVYMDYAKNIEYILSEDTTLYMWYIGGKVLMPILYNVNSRQDIFKQIHDIDLEYKDLPGNTDDKFRSIVFSIQKYMLQKLTIKMNEFKSN